MYPPNSRENCIVRRLPEPAKKVWDYYSMIDALLPWRKKHSVMLNQEQRMKLLSLLELSVGASKSYTLGYNPGGALKKRNICNYVTYMGLEK